MTRFQFGLRAMLLWVAAFGALFAVLGKVGPVWQVVIVWFVMLASAHVLANVLGSQFGDKRRAGPDGDVVSGGREPPGVGARCIPPRFAPATRLRETARLGRAPLALAMLGALLGGSLGTIAFALGSWPRSGYAGVIVAGVSSSVVGGLLAFLSGSFLQTAVQAIHEAANPMELADNAHPAEANGVGDRLHPGGPTQEIAGADRSHPASSSSGSALNSTDS
ncbi:MAG TPA: hypothetical protein VMV69_06435 [Pirellulales bacterium]|nr:hypothetical protein [Pirellulales bacterium]